MKKYTVIKQRAVIPAGTEVGLSDEQAAKRQSSLQCVKKGVYLVLENIQFKSGEQLQLDDPSKSLLEALTVHLTKKEMDNLAKKDDVDRETKDLKAELETANDQIQNLSNVIDEKDKELADVQVANGDLSNEIASLQEAQTDLLKQISELEGQLEKATDPVQADILDNQSKKEKS